MLRLQKILIVLIFSITVFTFAAPVANAAKGSAYKAIVNHLKTKYQAKKVKIPMLWLARFAVGVVHPAGVKSFSITKFENLQCAPATLDAEMQSVLRNSLSEDWSPILRVRSRDGQQVYLYMRDTGTNVKITLVTIDKNQAAIIRATFNPDKLANFVNNPQMFGISLNETSESAKSKTFPATENSTSEEKTNEPKKDLLK
ncbi:MAG: hypothetical protein ABI954_06130 [Pyrinomonadaceae bacterium]